MMRDAKGKDDNIFLHSLNVLVFIRIIQTLFFRNPDKSTHVYNSKQCVNIWHYNFTIRKIANFKQTLKKINKNIKVSFEKYHM
jgi:hypothetical protein